MEKAYICLLVEDDEDDQDFFKYALKKLDIPVELVIADDGAYALQKLEEEAFTPDVIFMDLNMPRLNGLECIREIKKNPRIKDIPVYIYSTAHEYQNNIDISSLGIKQYLEKPGDVMGLIPILSRVFSSMKHT
jgi:CheY-like chemotaxis protein